MVDKNYCMSSYMAFRFVERDDMDFFPGMKHKVFKRVELKDKKIIYSANDIDAAIKSDFDSNLTKYKSIYFDIEVVSALGTNQWPRLGLSTNNNQNDYGVGEVTIENTVGRKLYYIDLTDKTELAFVKAHINSGSGAVSPFMNIKIYNIWLEENLEKLPTSTDLSNAIQYNENINSEISTLKIKLENNLIQKRVLKS